MSSLELPRRDGKPSCSKNLISHTWWPNGPCWSILAWQSWRSSRTWGSLHPRRPWGPSLACRPYSDKTKLKESHKRSFQRTRKAVAPWKGCWGHLLSTLDTWLAGSTPPLLHLRGQGKAGSWDLGSSLMDKSTPGTMVGLQFMLGRAKGKPLRLSYAVVGRA